MSKKSNTPGKTLPQVLRAIEASMRKALRDSRTDQEQLELLDTRPGKSLRERVRLTEV